MPAQGVPRGLRQRNFIDPNAPRSDRSVPTHVPALRIHAFECQSRRARGCRNEPLATRVAGANPGGARGNLPRSTCHASGRARDCRPPRRPIWRIERGPTVATCFTRGDVFARATYPAAQWIGHLTAGPTFPSAAGPALPFTGGGASSGSSPCGTARRDVRKDRPAECT
jgi:hypothetical protein